MTGDIVTARKQIADLQKRFSEDTIIRVCFLPTIQAAIDLDRGNATLALQDLQIAGAYDLGQNPPALIPVYLRAKAYLTAHRGAEAAVEFQKILDHRGVVNNDPMGAPIDALAHLGLAKAQSLMGDLTKARAEYQDLLTVWKDADPTLPALKQAQAEYQHLK